MDQRIIESVAAAGFDVWMRDDAERGTYMIYTDGKSLGYLQYERSAGYSISTVHVPNSRTGTGFQIERYVDKIDRDTLRLAFIHAPHWAGNDSATVRKYRDIEDYRKASPFNAGYKLVAKGAA